jgi:hypothetical protein
MHPDIASALCLALGGVLLAALILDPSNLGWAWSSWALAVLISGLIFCLMALNQIVLGQWVASPAVKLRCQVLASLAFVALLTTCYVLSPYSLRSSKLPTLDLGNLIRNPEWLIATAMGLILVAMGARNLRRLYQVAKWPTANGTILSASVSQKADRNISPWPIYSPEVTFEYVVAGRKMKGNKFSIDPKAFWYTDRDQALALLNDYHVGGVAEVYVSPADASIAVLRREPDPGCTNHNLAVVVGGVLLVLLSVVAPVWR